MEKTVFFPLPLPSLFFSLGFLVAIPKKLELPRGYKLYELYIRSQKLLEGHKFSSFALVIEENLLPYRLIVLVEASDDQVIEEYSRYEGCLCSKQRYREKKTEVKRKADRAAATEAETKRAAEVPEAESQKSQEKNFVDGIIIPRVEVMKDPKDMISLRHRKRKATTDPEVVGISVTEEGTPESNQVVVFEPSSYSQTIAEPGSPATSGNLFLDGASLAGGQNIKGLLSPTHLRELGPSHKLFEGSN